ncbi:hypothetical protein GY14_20915 [Delftia tsuruhatensis]|nr:hypothetical protein GY14_20915 [Delftia tsuruhatensis]
MCEQCEPPLPARAGLRDQRVCSFFALSLQLGQILFGERHNRPLLPPYAVDLDRLDFDGLLRVSVMIRRVGGLNERIALRRDKWHAKNRVRVPGLDVQDR